VPIPWVEMNDGRPPILLVLGGLLGIIGALIMNTDSTLVSVISWSCLGAGAVLVAIAVILPVVAPPHSDQGTDVDATAPGRSHQPVGLRR
jgi:hypothetical protein